MADTKKLVFIVGSLRRGSFNRVLAEHAKAHVGERAEVEILDYADVPFMNEDIERPAPEAVTRTRETVLAADGVWIFTPEYNFSFPAPIKNLLDWFSRPLVAGDYDTPRPLTGKPVALSGVGGKGATAGVRRAFVPYLTYLQAKLVDGEGEGFVLPDEVWGGAAYEIPAGDVERLDRQAEKLLAAL